MADHRPVAVVDLGLIARCGRDDHACFRWLAAVQLEHEAPHAGVAGGEAVIADEILPDRDRVAAAPQRLRDHLAVRLTGAGTRRPPRLGHRRRSRRGVGGHLPRNGRFCRPGPGPPTATHRNAGRLEVGARRLTTDRGGLLDPPEGPPQAAKSQDLLLLFVVQDIAHSGEGARAPCRRQRLGPPRLMAGFQLSINGRFWVSTEALRKLFPLVRSIAVLASQEV